MEKYLDLQAAQEGADTGKYNVISILEVEGPDGGRFFVMASANRAVIEKSLPSEIKRIIGEFPTLATLRFEAQKAAEMAIEGYPIIQSLADAMCDARDAYVRKSDYGYPQREAEACKSAEAKFSEAQRLYPRAAAYYRMAAWRDYGDWRLPQKSAIGKRACSRILAWDDYAIVLADAEADWAADCQKAID